MPNTANPKNGQGIFISFFLKNVLGIAKVATLCAPARNFPKGCGGDSNHQHWTFKNTAEFPLGIAAQHECWGMSFSIPKFLKKNFHANIAGIFMAATGDLWRFFRDGGHRCVPFAWKSPASWTISGHRRSVWPGAVGKTTRKGHLPPVSAMRHPVFRRVRFQSGPGSPIQPGPRTFQGWV